jgi:hypothetical protein
MGVTQLQTIAQEPQVRAAIEAAYHAQAGQTIENVAGKLVMDLGGGVGMMWVAGGFRNKLKMPMRVIVTTAGGPGGTGVTIDVHSRGTGGGALGGALGISKQNKAEKIWAQTAIDAVAQMAGQPPQVLPPPGPQPAGAPAAPPPEAGPPGSPPQPPG